MAVDERPIFILGTGRCGSTFVQTALCATADIWIWGEHAGLLKGLFHWAENVRAAPLLVEASYPYRQIDPLDRLAGRGGVAPWMTAWINGFGPDTLDDIERMVLRRLFAEGLPAGKRRWGFKEIRYGGTEATPERLLALFPAARIVHVVRHPFATAESSMSAWWAKGFQEALAAGNRPLVLDHYRRLLQQWTEVTGRFLQLEAARPEAVASFRIEDGEAMLGALAAFLGVDEAGLRRAGATAGFRNTSSVLRDNHSEDVARLLGSCRDELLPLVGELAARLGYEPDGSVIASPAAAGR